MGVAVEIAILERFSARRPGRPPNAPEPIRITMTRSYVARRGQDAVSLGFCLKCGGTLFEEGRLIDEDAVAFREIGCLSCGARYYV